jgi:hypothetical protein
MLRLFAFAAFTAIVAGSASAQQGNNGAKVGRWGFLLNVNAYARCPAGDFTDSNRHMIAVQADFSGVATDKASKVNKIFLQSGDEFWVEDGNACDGTGARFHLPITSANCVDCGDPTVTPTFTEYAVKARVLGKPGGRVTVTSCTEMLMVDPVTGLETLTSLCSVGEENVWVGTRTTGGGKTQNRWENVSTELLTVCIDTSGDGVCDERIGLFDSRGEDYWWNWDTVGRPHVQLVFLPIASGAAAQ